MVGQIIFKRLGDCLILTSLRIMKRKRVFSVAMGPLVATCLALDKARKENEIFVTSENQKVLLN
jgi:hypothetical protein